MPKRLRVMLERLKRFAKGLNRDCAPAYPIEFWSKFKVMLDSLLRFPKGDNSD